MGPEDAWRRLSELADRHRRFLLVSHLDADGDSIGSLAGFGYYLRDRGREVQLLQPDGIPEAFRFVLGDLPLLDLAKIPDPPPPEQPWEVTFLLDVGEWYRIGKAEAYVRQYGGKTVRLDHHPGGRSFSEADLVDPALSCTAEILAGWREAEDRPLSPPLAQALYLAVMTDTGSFRYTNTSPRALRMAADCLAAGVDPDLVYRRVYAGFRVARLQMLRLALGSLAVEEGGRLVWFCQTREMYRESGATEEDLVDFVEYFRPLRDLRILAGFREEPDGRIKVSLRSIPPYEVLEAARQCGGGGHRLAAGATMDGPLDRAWDRLLPLLRRELQRR